MTFRLCSTQNRPKLEDCLERAGRPYLKYNCRTDSLYSYYINPRLTRFIDVLSVANITTLVFAVT